MKNRSNFVWPCVMLTLAVVGVGFLTSCACCRRAAPANAMEPLGFLLRTNYHGWSNSIWMSNGQVEAIVVPEIGRVLQFRFAGETEGPFWENESLYGKAPDSESTTWMNFGGDKVWPAPQSGWQHIAPTNWPPPVGFDATPVEADINGWEVTLISPIDPSFGIRTRRHIVLEPGRAQMTITTTFVKVNGAPLNTSIWTLTQLKNPVGIYSPTAVMTGFLEGFMLLAGERPPSLKVTDGILSLTRDPKKPHKIGLDAHTLLWVGQESMLIINSPRIVSADYPEKGSSIAVETVPDPQAYVSLETMGPTQRVIPGDTMERRSTYRLLRRTELEPDLDVQKLLD